MTTTDQNSSRPALGIDIAIEFLPFASINTIDRGLDLFRDLGVTNGGLLVDTWHVERGGMTADDIRKIPTEFLRAAARPRTRSR